MREDTPVDLETTHDAISSLPAKLQISAFSFLVSTARSENLR